MNVSHEEAEARATASTLRARAAKARANRADHSQVRQLQVALGVATCIQIAAKYSEGDIDLADALAGLLQRLEITASILDTPVVRHGHA